MTNFTRIAPIQISANANYSESRPALVVDRVPSFEYFLVHREDAGNHHPSE
jgi:hypothetical protein